MPLSLVHAAEIAGILTAAGLLVRRSCDAVLRLVAGMVVILARDKRSRAERAMAVLRAILRPGKPRLLTGAVML